MKYLLLLIWLSSGWVTECMAADDVPTQPPDPQASSTPNWDGFVMLPNPTNAVQFRLYTNAAPDAAHLFNTFEIEGYGQQLLPSPGGENLKRWRAKTPSDPSLHNLLVDGTGPELGGKNGMTLIEQASGPDWCYVALDVTPAYGGRLKQYRRSILFVAPDLFILHDHVVAKQPVNLQMLLHPLTVTRVDPIWHDLRMELPKASLHIHAPSRRELRVWERVVSPADSIFPDTVTMKLGPTNEVTQVELLTVFAVQPGGKKADYVFKRVESNTAIGARIHRDALPTLVAFRLEANNPAPSLDGFKLTGPVGVSVFRPTRNPR